MNFNRLKTSLILVLVMTLQACGGGGGGGGEGGSVQIFMQANAGIDLFTRTGMPVFLDGSSSRVTTESNYGAPYEGNYTYSWTLERPTGSSAEITNVSQVNPSFIPDVDGEYTVSLVVSIDELLADNESIDNEDEQHEITIYASSSDNIKPNANTGISLLPSQEWRIVEGAPVILDASKSFDYDNNNLIYFWSIRDALGNILSIPNSDAVQTELNILRSGLYTLLLEVSDGIESTIDEIKVKVVESSSSEKFKSIAYAGADQTREVKSLVTLSGSYFYLAPSETATYKWRIAAKPAESSAELNNPNIKNARFTPDVAGIYVLAFQVSGGIEDTVIIRAYDRQPVCTASAPTTLDVGQEASLLGDTDADRSDENPLYFWSVNRKPANSKTTIHPSNSKTPQFTGDKPGIYELSFSTYYSNVSCTSSKVSIEVFDREPPILSLIGDNPETIERSQPYTDPGATAQDNVDGGLTSDINIQSNLDTDSVGEYVVIYSVVDSSGNATQAERTVIVEDTTRPESSILVQPSTPTKNTSQTITFTSNEPSTYRCRLNSSAYASCASPVVYNNLGDANYTFSVLATDLAGNEESEASSVSWRVDKAAPSTTITDEPPSLINSANVRFSFESNESGSTFECSLDDSVFTDCESPIEYSGLSEGLHNFSVLAIDPAGNRELEAETRAWMVDTAPPETTITVFPNETSYESTASFSFVANEASSFKCSIDGSIPASCSSPISYENLDDSTHTFSVQATDSADNTELTAALYTWTIDTTPHTLEALDQTVAVESGSFVDITLTATDSRGHDLTFALSPTVMPASGSLSGIEPTVTYTPDSVCNTTDSFGFTATDDELISEAATVNIIIYCDYYDIGGSISGLTAGSLEISLNESETITLSGNGAFSFVSQLHWGQEYNVTVSEQPAGQECSITNASGTATAQVSDITVTCVSAPVIIFSENFESGGASWSSPDGIWEIGAVTFGPIGCIEGTQCVGTTLSGNYPDSLDADLVSPSIQLPDNLAINQEIQLRFQHWFSFGYATDKGLVLVERQDNNGNWNNLVTIINTADDFNGLTSTGTWSTFMADLSRYAGQKIRLRFRLDQSSVGSNGVDAGWYIDDLSIEITTVKSLLPYAEEFENGFTEWWTDNGVWQIGTPSDVGPDSCVSGLTCAGTTLSGNYPDSLDADLVSPSIQLPDNLAINQEIQLRFQHWFSFGYATDKGLVLVERQDNNGNWNNLVTIINTADDFNGLTSTGTWATFMADLSSYAGQKIRLRFRLDQSTVGSNGVDAGWYLDDLSISIE